MIHAGPSPRIVRLAVFPGIDQVRYVRLTHRERIDRNGGSNAMIVYLNLSLHFANYMACECSSLILEDGVCCSEANGSSNEESERSLLTSTKCSPSTLTS